MIRRLRYLFFVFVVIAAGLLSRRIPAIPPSVGDALYAVMIFCLVRFLFISGSITWVAGISLAICFAIECSQLCQAHWLNMIRKTVLGRLVLGSGFLWSDLVAYTIGILIAAITAKRLR